MKPLVYAILLLVLLGTLDAALARPKRARPKRASPAVFMDGRRWYPHPHAFRPKRASLAHPLLDQREPSPRRFRLKRHSLAHPLLDQREPSPRRFRPKRARLVSRTSYDPEGDFAMSHHYRPKRASPAHASGPRMLRGGGAEMGPVTRYSTVDPNDYYPDWYTPPSYWTDLGYGSSWDYGSDMSPYGDYYLNLNDQLFGSDGDWTNGGSGDFSSVYGGYGDYGSY